MNIWFREELGLPKFTAEVLITQLAHMHRAVAWPAARCPRMMVITERRGATLGVYSGGPWNKGAATIPPRFGVY